MDQKPEARGPRLEASKKRILRTCWNWLLEPFRLWGYLRVLWRDVASAMEKDILHVYDTTDLLMPLHPILLVVVFVTHLFMPQQFVCD